MLQINLIPLERRRKERTPLPRFFIIIGAVVLCLGLALWDAKTVLDTKSLKNTLADKKKELQEIQIPLGEFPKWQERQKTLVEWKKAAEAVRISRPFKWWYAMDTLLDIFSDFPTLWVTNFTTSESGPAGGGKTSVEAMIAFNCLCFGPAGDPGTTVMTNFRRKLKNTAELTNIFNGGINEQLSFDRADLTDAKEEKGTRFSIELYRIPAEEGIK